MKTKQLRWLAATLMLVAAMVMPSTAWAQSSYTDDFVGGRTDFRDESIYFVLTTRFYDGDKSNNAYCWDHSAAGNGMDAEWRGDFKGTHRKARLHQGPWIHCSVDLTCGREWLRL